MIVQYIISLSLLSHIIFYYVHIRSSEIYDKSQFGNGFPNCCQVVKTGGPRFQPHYTTGIFFLQSTLSYTSKERLPLEEHALLVPGDLAFPFRPSLATTVVNPLKVKKKKKKKNFQKQELIQWRMWREQYAEGSGWVERKFIKGVPRLTMFVLILAAIFLPVCTHFFLLVPLSGQVEWTSHVCLLIWGEPNLSLPTTFCKVYECSQLSVSAFSLFVVCLVLCLKMLAVFHSVSIFLISWTETTSACQ